MNAEEIKLVINPIMETGDIKTAVNQIQSFFNKMNLSKGMKGDMESIFRELTGEVETFEKKSKEAFKTSGDVKSFENSGKKIVSLFEKISTAMNKLEGEDLNRLFTIDDSRIASMTQEIAKLQQKINQLSAGEIKNITTAIQQMNTVSKSGSISKFFDAFKAGDMSAAETALKGLIQNVQAFGGSTADTKAAINLMMQAFDDGKIDDVKSSFDMLEDSLTGAKGNIKEYVSQLGILINSFAALSGNGDINQAKQDILSLEQSIDRIETENANKLAAGFNNAAPAIQKCEQNTREFTKSMTDSASRTQSLNNEIQELGQRATYFLSLENSVDLFRQGIRKAIETVKELDKAMTETAVVTDFNIGDMWDRLPEYTQMANELGVATQGVYEASTLYYQQGLQTNEVMALTAETLKMARIAGLECADATNLMTAALRGFNMEINETSAQRVNDVYSELAAITAADTNEIATAMTKTASIAASANMELETTAALLAQMIETTREPAETAGTAMKTIIARFTEMKEAASDVISIDGEEVSVNKVDAALASVGVSLKNAKGEFRDLDDVFIELASKWNSLDMMSQRYIATMAAGSRQQSRFIAMMSNYDRTLELVDAAYSSAGASSRQFEKTQESLESKLARLQNAWNTFLMGIADDKIIKTLVDALTGLLDAYNTLTSRMDGVFGSAVRLGTVFAGLRLAKLGIDKGVRHFIELKGAIEGTTTATKGLTILESLSQKIRNFKLGQGFIINADINTKGMEAKMAKASSDIALLKAAISEPVVPGMTLAFEEINGKLVVTSAMVEGTTDSIKMNLSEVGMEALLASEACEEIGEDLTKSGMQGKTALGILQKEYLETIALAEALDKANDGDIIEFRGNKIAANTNSRKYWKNRGQALEGDINNINSKVQPATAKNGIKAYFQSAKTSIEALISTLGTLAPLLAGIIATVGALAAIWAIAWYVSPVQVATREVKSLANAADVAARSVSNIKKAFDDLTSGHENLQQLKEDLNQLVPGSDAYNDKIKEINSTTAELLKNNPDLLLTDSQGPYAEINEGSYEKLKEELTKKQAVASGTEIMLNADLEVATKELENIKELDELQKKVDTSKLVSGFWGALGGLGGGVAGFLGGELLGLGVGGAIGSVAGGVGAIPGLLIGLAGGGITGAVGGAAMAGKAAYNKSVENQAEKNSEYIEQQAILQRDLALQRRSRDNSYILAISQGLTDINKENKNMVSKALLYNLENRQASESKGIGIGDKNLFNLNGANKKEIAEWAEKSGYTMKGKKVYDSEGNEIDTKDNEAIAQQLAYMRALEKTQKDAKVIEDYLSTAGQNFQDIFSGNLYTEINEDDLIKNAGVGKDKISKLQTDLLESINSIGDINKRKDILSSILGIDSQDINTDELDSYIDKAAAILEKKSLEILQYRKEQSAIFQQSMQTLIFGDLEDKEYFSSKMDETYTLEQKSAIQDFRDKISETLGKDFSNEVTLSLVLSKDSEKVIDTINELNTLDLSNPIKGFKQINSLSTKENKILEQTKNQLLKLSFYSIENQFKTLYTDLLSNEDTKKILDDALKDGSIDSKEIDELSKSYDNLSYFLGNANMSSETLAQTLTKLEEGTIELEGLTSSVISSISVITSTKDLLNQSSKELEDFNDEITDTMKNVDDFIKNGEELEELTKNKEYGNLALTQTIEFVYGKEVFNNLEKDSKEYIQEIQKKQKELSQWNTYEGMGFFQSLASDSKYEDFTYDKNGNINYNIGNKTTDEIIASLMEAKNISEEAARIYWQTYISHSPDAQAKVLQNEKDRAIQTFMTEKSLQSGFLTNSIVATEKEIKALASFTGKTFKQVKKELEANQVKVINTDPETIKDIDSIVKYIKESFDTTSEDIAKTFSLGTLDGQKIINVDLLKSELMNTLSITEEQANAVINSIAQETGSLVGSSVITGIDEAGNAINSIFTGIDTTELTAKLNQAEQTVTPFSDLLAQQNYTEIGNILTNILDGVATSFRNKLANAIRGIAKKLLAVLAVAGSYLDEEPGHISYKDALATVDDIFADSGSGNGSGDGSGTTGDGNVVETDFDTRMKSAGYEEFNEEKDTGTDKPSEATSGYFKKGPTSKYTDEETKFSYEATPVTYRWKNEDGQEFSETVMKYKYYNGDGKPIDKEEYEKGTKKQTVGYIPPASDSADKGGSSKDEKDEKAEKTIYAEENANKQLEALDRVRQTNDREAELIEKLPEEIQFPLKMANLGEDMFYEYQEIQINKNKLAALKSQKQMEQANAEFLNKYYYFDELLGAYMYNVDAINSLSDEDRNKVEEEINSLQELQDKINDVNQELDGGKIQKIFRGLAKASTDTSKALKGTSKASDMLEEEFGNLADKFGLGDQLDKFGKNLDSAIDESKFLKKEFKGLGIASEDMLSKIDNLPFGDATKSLIKNTLGTNENGTIGSFLGDSFGAAGEMFDGLADVLNFDMMSMGLDAFNNMKDMASKIIQQVVSVIQTVVNWWTNREDWLYNLLSAIEQEVHNFNRQEQVEERFRLYSDEGLNDLVSAWEAMRASLEKQIDLNEQLIKSRQAELQFLNLTNLPFSPAFYYDYKEERVIENPWVYDIYILLLDLGSMIPEIGGVFSSIKQLMEDNKKRMEDAVDEIESAREQILELEKQQLELRTKYMEDEEELEQLVMDAIIEKQQEEIDELTAMSDAISEGNQKLIDALNDNLDKIREMRDNQDREEELAQKERRLAYLRQDTSGANRAQILDLQKELEDERRDYTDNLIDQKISELEKQNEDAAAQRQKQIDLLQEQLDYTEKYGLQWKEAQTLIKNGFDNEGRLRVGSELFDLLMSKEDFTSLGNGSTRQNKQIMDWNVTGIAAAAYREINHIWDKGFGNFEMSNDVHDQSRLHLWEDRDIEYRQLPSWLSFLQPAYNSIQDYAWRTKQNLGSFIETGYLSGSNSSSILGKTVVPLIQRIAANIEAMVNDYKSISDAETGGVQKIAGVITSSTDNLGLSLGERILSGFSKSISTLGDDIINGVKVATQSNSFKTVTSTQNYGDIVFNNHFNSEENGDSIIERMVDFFRRGNQGLSVV